MGGGSVDETKGIGKYRTSEQRPLILKLNSGNKKMEILRKAQI